MRNSKLFIVLLVLISCPFFMTVIQAQETTASLGGTIKDPKGTVADGASITLRHEPTGFTSHALSNAKGYFYINNLQPGGPYTLNISYVGSAAFDTSNLVLTLGSNSFNQ